MVLVEVVGRTGTHSPTILVVLVMGGFSSTLREDMMELEHFQEIDQAVVVVLVVLEVVGGSNAGPGGVEFR